MYSVIGFIVGGVIMMVFGAVTAKYFARKIVSDIVSNETKDKLTKWLEDSIRNGVGNAIFEALKDEDVRELIIHILKLSEKKLSQKEESGENKTNTIW